MVFYTDSRIVNNCHVEQTFLVRFTAGPVYGREGVLNGGYAPRSNQIWLLRQNFPKNLVLESHLKLARLKVRAALIQSNKKGL